MSSTAAGWLQFALLVAALAACYVPLGNYIARIFTAKEHWRVERGIYKLCGIDPEADMRWSVYVRSMLAFSLVSVLFLYLIERTQHWLFLSVGMANVTPVTAWNTAASFTTNTNWQNYSGESTMSYLTQMSGLAVQNFVSAAVGLAVAIAMIRGFTRSRTDKLGNFWVDLTRGDDPAAAAAVGHRRASSWWPAARSRTSPPTTRSPRWPAGTRPSSAARWPRRRSSRSWATTAAASSTPTRPIRSRTRTRSRTSSRSS